MKNNAFFGAYSRRFSNYSTSASGSFTLSVTTADPNMGTAGAIKLSSVGSDNYTPSQNQGDRGGSSTSKTFPSGTRFRAVATPKAGYEFVGWKTNLGAASQGTRIINTNPIEFALTQNVVLTAQFKQKQKAQEDKTLNVSWDGTMGRVNCNAQAFTYGSSSPANSGSITAPEGTSVTLSAEPKAGYRFVRWNGLNIAGNVQDNTSSTITIAIRNITITAVFEEDNGGGGGETPGGGGGFGPTGPGVINPYSGNTNGVGIMDLLKKWWWVLLIAYIVYKETKGGAQ